MPVSGGVLWTPRDDGLQGHVVLVCGLADVGVERVIADRLGEVIRAGFLVLLLPYAAAFNQLTTRGSDRGRGA